MDLTEGADFREPQYRQEVFLRFYDFHLRHEAHPGCVYALFPWLADYYGWTETEMVWFAFLNGNTQNPITSLELWSVAPTPDYAPQAIAHWRKNYNRLQWDTDRRYHKKSFELAVESYLAATGPDHVQFWRERQAGGWTRMWETARSLFTFGRLSAWSYLEYLWLAGYGVDADTLMLNDRSGSRSHRNGLCIVSGLDEFDWHKSNPEFNGVYEPDLIEQLATTGEGLLAEAQKRAANPADVTRLTLESALCTFKSWFRPNRRYPGVYIDMMLDRVGHAGPDREPVWMEARTQLWPSFLLLEDNPGDPGVHPLKQNHFRLTGEVPVMGHEKPIFWSDFDTNVKAEVYGKYRPDRSSEL